MAKVKFRELREARPFRHDEADELAAVGAVYFAHEPIGQPLQHGSYQHSHQRRALKCATYPWSLLAS
jgi:hypothetical protein